MKLDFSKKSFQVTQNQAFTMARERERIGIFLNKANAYGIPESNLFQTDYLYERTNLVQVCTCIRALGIEVRMVDLVMTYHNYVYCCCCSDSQFGSLYSAVTL